MRQIFITLSVVALLMVASASHGQFLGHNFKGDFGLQSGS